MNGGEWNKSDRSAEQFALNLPPRLAHLNSAGSSALRGSEKIMVHSDNASAPADTEGSPRPLPLVMKNEYLAHCPLILLSLSAHALILSLMITGLLWGGGLKYMA